VRRRPRPQGGGVVANGAARAPRAAQRANGAFRPATERERGDEVLRFGVPRKGSWQDQGLAFLENCGLKVRRESDRQLTASLGGVPGVTVVLQRAEDIVNQVADGKLDIGLAGYDQVRELLGEATDVVVLHDALGFSMGDVVVAVPDSWIDVSTLADLADVALELRERGDDLRVATSFPNLARRFFYSHGISHFSFVELAGGVEAAPNIGFADIVVDITTTGTSIRENHLKVLRNGVVMRFQACLIGNRRALAASAAKREPTRRILELIEARLRGQAYYSITGNLRGASEEDVAAALLRSPATRGRRGPTVARVFTADPLDPDGGAWFAATVIVESGDLQPAVDHLRAVGGSGISVVPLRFLYDERSHRYETLLAELGVKTPVAVP
jgi:ATP phosphoribosyltransferase